MKAHVLPLVAAISAATISMHTLAEGPIDGKVYGKLNVWLESQDLDKASSTSQEGRTTNVISDASRLGFKGATKLDEQGDLNVTYQIEYEVSADDGDKDGQTFTQRNTFVGLKGGLGEVRVGMHDTPFKEAQGKVDQFNDLRGDLKSVFDGEIRQKNTVYYTSPEVNGISGALAYSAPEDRVNENDAISAAVSAKMGDLYAALAYDNDAMDQTKAGDIQVEAYRLVATYKLDAVTLGAMWQQENAKVAGSKDEDGLLISAAFGISEAMTLKAQYAAADIKAKGKDQISVGGDYKLAKSTKLFAFHTQEDADAKDSGKAWTGIGIEHNF